MRLQKLGLWTLAVVLLGALAFGGAIAYFFVAAKVDTVGKVDFDRPLAVPPLADSRLGAKGRRVFDLSMQRGSTDFGRDAKTPTWGMNGSHLAPTLRASRGETVVANVTNDLGEASTVHWHGMHLPTRMDGGPHQMIEPGDTWSPTWQVRQPAATLSYHPHPHGETAEHFYRGFAGMFILDDPAESAVQAQLPSSYGVDDLPVIVQDKLLDGTRLDETKSLFTSTGILGDTVLVNGTPGPYLDVTSQRVRLRRPGERAEIVMTMTPGEKAVLRSAPLDGFSNRFAGTEDPLDVSSFGPATRCRRRRGCPSA
ncbi:MAG: multicopper oxidase family protein [Aeromicrobium sp.]